jgi:hypothetical protein
MIIRGAKNTQSDLEYEKSTGAVDCQVGVVLMLGLFLLVSMYSSYSGAKNGIKDYIAGKYDVEYTHDSDSIITDTTIVIDIKKYTEDFLK